jgi:hypothetical protein
MMTIFKSGDRAGFRGRACTLAVVTTLTLGLGGCKGLDDYTNFTQLANFGKELREIVQSEERLKAEMQALSADIRGRRLCRA